MELWPKQAGFAPERLNRGTDHLNRNYIEPGKIAGCQTLVARHGHVAYFKSLGLMDRERHKPMADDTIFRLYSMTKPIASVALMTLYEQGYFQLNDPVSRFIPEWRDHRVWLSGEGAAMQTAAPERPMSMRHLLSHTGGLTYGATNTRSIAPTRSLGCGAATAKRCVISSGSSPRCRCVTIRVSAGCTRCRPMSAAT